MDPDVLGVCNLDYLVIFATEDLHRKDKNEMAMKNFTEFMSKMNYYFFKDQKSAIFYKKERVV